MTRNRNKPPIFENSTHLFISPSILNFVNTDPFNKIDSSIPNWNKFEDF